MKNQTQYKLQPTYEGTGHKEYNEGTRHRQYNEGIGHKDLKEYNKRTGHKLTKNTTKGPDIKSMLIQLYKEGTRHREYHEGTRHKKYVDTTLQGRNQPQRIPRRDQT